MFSWPGHPLAAIFDSDTIWILIPLTALLIPIVAVLVKHQQTMAQIVHGGGRQMEMDQLRSELEMVKQQLAYQAGQLNDVRMIAERGQQIPPTAPEDVRGRVGS